MFQFKKEEVLTALRTALADGKSADAKIHEHVCTCGCNVSNFFVRDERGIWISSTISHLSQPLVFVARDTGELESFMKFLAVDSPLRPLLWSCFREKMS